MQRSVPVVIIGSGLAGLTSAYKLIDHKVPVLLLEKTNSIGGNSIKASSGINGCNTTTQSISNITDNNEIFFSDTSKSAGNLGNRTLQSILVNDSQKAIHWLKKDIGVTLDIVNQLGGHSRQRTHRSNGIPPGFEIISKLKSKLIENKLFELKLNSKVIDIDIKDNKVNGLTYFDAISQKNETIKASNIILATGGFGYSKDLIRKFKPEYQHLSTTNGDQTLGEGHLLIESIGGELIDMDQIQIHPTGFIKQDDRDNHWKFLAAESLRGIGGVLINTDKLERFVNELDTRDKVSSEIRKQKDEIAYLVLNDEMYKDFQFQIDFYKKQNLIQEISAIEKFKDIEKAKKFIKTLRDYSKDEKDEFNRNYKAHLFDLNINVDTPLLIAEITPVVHFTMGGVKINDIGQVLKKDESIINGLYAIGEVSGGVHGQNRLGGNSLLECVVFGTRAANDIVKYHL